MLKAIDAGGTAEPALNRRPEVTVRETVRPEARTEGPDTGGGTGAPAGSPPRRGTPRWTEPDVPPDGPPVYTIYRPDTGDVTVPARPARRPESASLPR